MSELKLLYEVAAEPRILVRYGVVRQHADGVGEQIPSGIANVALVGSNVIAVVVEGVVDKREPRPVVGFVVHVEVGAMCGYGHGCCGCGRNFTRPGRNSVTVLIDKIELALELDYLALEHFGVATRESASCEFVTGLAMKTDLFARCAAGLEPITFYFLETTPVARLRRPDLVRQQQLAVFRRRRIAVFSLAHFWRGGRQSTETD